MDGRISLYPISLGESVSSLVSHTEFYGWVDNCVVFLPLSLYSTRFLSLQMLEDANHHRISQRICKVFSGFADFSGQVERSLRDSPEI
jgi:hypothetical protein